MTLEEYKKEVGKNIENLFNKANGEEKALLNRMINTINDLCKEKQELIDYLKEKENELQKKVIYYEKQLKGTERNSFYYSSYLKNIHKLNAQRELIKEILSKIEKSDK